MAKRTFTKYPTKVTASTEESINSAIAKAKEQIRDSSEHFINDEGEDCFAIYEDDAIAIITNILNGLK